MPTETADKPQIAKRGPGRPPLYGEPTRRRTIDIPDTIYLLIQRHAERNKTSAGQVVVDSLYDFFGLKNPKNGYRIDQ